MADDTVYKIIKNSPRTKAYGQYVFTDPEIAFENVGLRTKSHNDDLYTTVEVIDEQNIELLKGKYWCVDGDTGAGEIKDNADASMFCTSVDYLMNLRPISDVTAKNSVNLQQYYDITNYNYTLSSAPNKVTLQFDMSTEDKAFNVQVIPDSELTHIKDINYVVARWGDEGDAIQDYQLTEEYKSIIDDVMSNDLGKVKHPQTYELKHINDPLFHTYHSSGIKTIKVFVETRFYLYEGSCPLHDTTQPFYGLKTDWQYEQFRSYCLSDIVPYINAESGISCPDDFCSIIYTTHDYQMKCKKNKDVDCEHWYDWQERVANWSLFASGFTIAWLYLGWRKFWSQPKIDLDILKFKHTDCSGNENHYGTEVRLNAASELADDIYDSFWQYIGLDDDIVGGPYCHQHKGGNRSHAHGCAQALDGTYAEPRNWDWPWDGWSEISKQEHDDIVCGWGLADQAIISGLYSIGSTYSNRYDLISKHTYDVGCHHKDGGSPYDPSCTCYDENQQPTGAMTYGGCICGFICVTGGQNQYNTYATKTDCLAECIGLNSACVESKYIAKEQAPYIGYDYSADENKPEEELYNGIWPYDFGFIPTNGSCDPHLEYGFKAPVLNPKTAVTQKGIKHAKPSRTSFTEYFCNLPEIVDTYNSETKIISNTKLVTIKINLNTSEIYLDNFPEVGGVDFKFIPEPTVGSTYPIINGISPNSNYANDIKSLHNKQKGSFKDNERKDLQALQNAFRNNTLGHHIGSFDLAQTRVFKGARDMHDLLMLPPMGGYYCAGESNGDHWCVADTNIGNVCGDNSNGECTAYPPFVNYDDFDYWGITDLYSTDSCVGLLFITDSMTEQLREDCILELNGGETSTTQIFDTSGQQNIGILLGDFSIEKSNKEMSVSRDKTMILPQKSNQDGAF
jgi:hypothetical protein